MTVKHPYQQEWYRKNLDYNRTLRKEYARKFRKENPEKRLLQGAKTRSKERNLEIDIDITDIIIPEVCPILKVPFEVKTLYAPSLDRKDPSKGYVKGNVWVISRKANVMKNNASEEELKKFAEWILNA